MDRSKQYEFEARNVSACGAKSDWVLVSHTIPPISPSNIRLDDLQAEVTNAADEAAQANADLAKIASDNLLTTGEKPTVIRDYNVIVTEQAGIDAQATAFSITTEKTAYDAKVTALVNYIGTLTSPTSWNDITGDTDIDGPTLRTVFADVYTSRQALLNKIYAAAKALADAAQKSADDLAAEQYCYNPTFRMGLSGWTSVYNGAGVYTEAGTNSPDPNTATYLVREGQASPFVVLMENTGGGLPVRQGQGVTASIALRAVDPNTTALAYVRIEWLDKNRTSVGNSSEATGICSLDGGTDHFTQGVSRVKGVAPADACYAIVTIEYDGHTSGRFTATKASIGYTAASLDEVDDSATYARTQAFTMQNGVIVPFGNGDNLIPNHSFATNDSASPSGARAVGQSVCDGWYVGVLDDAYMSVQYEQTNADVLLRLLQGVLVPSGTTVQARIYGTRKIPVTPNETLYVALSGGRSANQSYPASVNLTAAGGLHVYNASGALIADLVASFDRSVTSGVTKYATITMPSTAAYAIPMVYVSHTPTVSSFNTSTGLYADVRISDLQVVRQLALETAGSGRRLGDLRNQVMVGVGSYGSGWSGGSLSYSSSNLSATITMGAASLKAGGNSIAYNQASTTISIAGPNTTGKDFTYYVYLDDDAYAGGSKAIAATTVELNTVSANGRVFVGEIVVHYPPSGTSSGTGTSPCPDEDAWVVRADPNGIRPDWVVRAKTIRRGHFLRLTDGTAGLVTYSERKAAPRVRVSSGGRSLTCSTSAPLELAGTTGDCVLAPESEGYIIKALASGAPRNVTIDDVKDAGQGWVQHITCQNACFWTGDDPDFLFGHHNMKQATP